MKRALLALSAALTIQSHAGIKYVISISVDGLRGDFLQTFIDTTPANFPSFVRLRNESAFTYNARTDYSQTVTIPDHISMFTGRTVHTTGGWPLANVHGVTSDAPAGTDLVHKYTTGSGINPNVYGYVQSIFDTVHDRSKSTALYLGKTRLGICERSWNATNGRLSAYLETSPGVNKLDYSSVVEAQNTSGATTTGFVNDLVAKIGAGTLKNYTHLHIADVDYAGHGSSWSTTVGGAYRTAAIQADGWVGQVLTEIDNNVSLSGKVAIILTADHGGGTPSNHHNAAGLNVTNFTIPFFVRAPGVTANTDLYSWFTNRTNPNSTQPLEYVASGPQPAQPVRNGDLGNIAATLVGVPFITGSTLQAEFKKPVTVAADGSGNPTVNWPIYLTGWTLESCDDLSAVPQIWTTVSTGITESATLKTHTVTPAPTARYFRLRSPL